MRGKAIDAVIAGVNFAGDSSMRVAVAGLDVAVHSLVRVARARVARVARAITMITHVDGGSCWRRDRVVWTNQRKESEWKRGVQAVGLATSNEVTTLRAQMVVRVWVSTELNKLYKHVIRCVKRIHTDEKTGSRG